eukprot:Skav223857  [mRNA]  locus=scaffold2304:515000:523433:- [translate_table: standard]
MLRLAAPPATAPVAPIAWRTPEVPGVLVGHVPLVVSWVGWLAWQLAATLLILLGWPVTVGYDVRPLSPHLGRRSIGSFSCRRQSQRAASMEAEESGDTNGSPEQVGFHRLPAVKTRRPRLPKEQADSITLFDAADMEAEVSQTFRLLMENLAHQHLTELSLARGGSRLTEQSLSRATSPTVDGGTSPGSYAEDGPESRFRKRRISQLMCEVQV